MRVVNIWIGSQLFFTAIDGYYKVPIVSVDESVKEHIYLGFTFKSTANSLHQTPLGPLVLLLSRSFSHHHSLGIWKEDRNQDLSGDRFATFWIANWVSISIIFRLMKDMKGMRNNHSHTSSLSIKWGPLGWPQFTNGWMDESFPGSRRFCWKADQAKAIHLDRPPGEV